MATMTKQVFIDAAVMVRNVLRGQWTLDAPAWADRDRYLDNNLALFQAPDLCYTRAVQMAECFILLFSAGNARFDRDKFLKACGLIK